MYKWFLAWRYLHTKMIAIFAVLGVTLCVAMVLTVLSVMGGFLDMLKLRSRGLLSDLVVENGFLQGWPYYEEFEAYLVEHHGDVVATSTPLIRNYGIFRIPENGYTKPTQVIGIKLDEYRVITNLGEGLHYDKYYPGTTTLGKQRQPVAALADDGSLVLPDDLEEALKQWKQTASPEEVAEYERNPFNPYATDGGDRVFFVLPDREISPGYIGEERYGVIVGTELLNERTSEGGYKRYLPRGAEVSVVLLPVTHLGNLSAEGAIKVPVRFADDSTTGIFQIDESSVYLEFDLLQQRLGMNTVETIDGDTIAKRTTQLLIQLRDGVELDRGREVVAQAWEKFYDQIAKDASIEDLNLLQHVNVQSWEDLQRSFIAAVEKEKLLVTFLFAIISGVAVVLIGCIFYMIVQKKTRDIGILKAIGASSPGVAGLFVIYSFAVGVVGSVLGTIVGATFTWYINDIQALLISLNPNLRVWDPAVYAFDRIPNVVKFWDVAIICSVAVLASMLGSLIPAVIAGRIWPVSALRYE